MMIQTFLSAFIFITFQLGALADSYKSSAFIQSASPTVVLDTTSSRLVGNVQQHVQNQIKNNPPINIKPSLGRQKETSLFAKKKKDTSVGKGGRIQVKLLKHIAGTGQAGDVVMVAPAFFTNKLQKTGSAVRISNDEVEKEKSDKALHDKEQKENATVVKEKLENMTFTLTKKAGPDGHLFGGVGYRTIMTELKNEFPQGCLDGKQVKITQIKSSEGKKLRGDIKEVGEYAVTVNLLKEISAALSLNVVAE